MLSVYVGASLSLKGIIFPWYSKFKFEVLRVLKEIEGMLEKKGIEGDNIPLIFKT